MDDEAYPNRRTGKTPGTRTALYLRVLTPDQKTDLQYDGLHGYAARSGLAIVGAYCDIAVSGRREERPQLNQLMAAARNRDLDCILVWKFDRFARSTRDLLTALEEFEHLGIRFVSVQDQIDTGSPMGRTMFTMIGAMAELESALISERVTAGMHAAQARGKHLGRPRLALHLIHEIERIAASTTRSVRQIQAISEAKSVVAASERSSKGYAQPPAKPREHFLHVSSTRPFMRSYNERILDRDFQSKDVACDRWFCWFVS